MVYVVLLVVILIAVVYMTRGRTLNTMKGSGRNTLTYYYMEGCYYC